MNKKFLSAVLFGALMVSSTGTFVSCKDYDEDIDRIDKELVDIKSALSALQAKVDAGKYVTNVVKNGDGITVTWSDNSTSTIETIKGDKGEDGKNGTVVTIIDGYWAFDGVKSEYPAKGDKGDKGDQGEPGDAAAAGHDAKISENGYWMVWDTEKAAYVETEYIAGGAVAAQVKGGWSVLNILLIDSIKCMHRISTIQDIHITHSSTARNKNSLFITIFILYSNVPATFYLCSYRTTGNIFCFNVCSLFGIPYHPVKIGRAHV